MHNNNKSALDFLKIIFVNPLRELARQELFRRSQLLALFLFFSFFFLLYSLLFNNFMAPYFLARVSLPLKITVLLFIAVCYGLNRRGYFYIAALGFLIFASLTLFLMILAQSDPNKEVRIILFFSVLVIFSTFLFKIRYAGLYILFNLALVGITPHFATELGYNFNFFSHFNFIILISLLSLAGAHFRNKMEADSNAFIRLHETSFQIIFDKNPDIVLILDLQSSKILKYNSAFATVTGYKGKVLLNKPFTDLLFNEDHAIFTRWLNTARQNEPAPQLSRLKKADGSAGFINSYFSFIPWQKTQAGLFILHDITKITKTEEQLILSEKKFRAFIEHTSDITFIIDKKGDIQYISPSATLESGYSIEELKQLIPSQIVHPADFSNLQHDYLNALNHPETILFIDHFRIIKKNQEISQFEGILFSMPDEPAINGVIVNCRNITARKQAEEALHWELAVNSGIAQLSQLLLSREQTLEAVAALTLKTSRELTGAANGYISFERWIGGDQKNRIIIGGQRIAPLEEFLSTSPLKNEAFYLNTQELHAVVSELKSSITNIMYLPVLTGDHLAGHVLLYNAALPFMQNSVKAVSQLVAHFVLGLLHKQAQETLLESEQRFREVTETIPNGIVEITTSGQITYINPGFCRLTGFGSGDLLGKEFWEFAENHQGLKEEITREIPLSLSPRNTFCRLKKKQGVFFNTRLDWEYQYNTKHSISGFIMVITDVSHQMEIEEQLRHAEKMQAIGQLAGGIAHDFNNQLAGIIGYAEILQEELHDNQTYKEYFDNIFLGVRRSADLTAKLLAFARRGKFQVMTVNIHQVVTEVISILKHSIDKKIRISKELDAAPPLTQGDPTQLQNALLNIALNSRDAMPDGGEIIFATTITQLDKTFCENSPFDIVPGLFILVTITDNGSGMDREILKHIFEPFFTTKETGKGTGMGMPAVYGTVKNHHGLIEISSKVGVGTKISIYLPLSTEEGVIPLMTTVKPHPAGHERILIIDDEEVFGKMAQTILETLGYLVITCSNGRQGVEFYRDNWTSIDLVILDMVMPEMGGKETFIELQRINEKVKVLLSSGYSLDGEAQQIMELGVMGFLQKPFRKSELAQKILDILHPRQGKQLHSPVDQY